MVPFQGFSRSPFFPEYCISIDTADTPTGDLPDVVGKVQHPFHELSAGNDFPDHYPG
jgi:hypothetical protein